MFSPSPRIHEQFQSHYHNIKPVSHSSWTVFGWFPPVFRPLIGLIAVTWFHLFNVYLMYMLYIWSIWLPPKNDGRCSLPPAELQFPALSAGIPTILTVHMGAAMATKGTSSCIWVQHIYTLIGIVSKASCIAWSKFANENHFCGLSPL